ncbi:MAG: ABC transporter substrate-binding protein [Roseiflexaceae bacterium]
MDTSIKTPYKNLILSSLVLFGLVLSACGATAPATPTAAPAPTSTPASEPASEPTAVPATQPLREITLAMPFIPNVQFAYYYMADKMGYYAEEGIKVNFDYNFETDVVQRVAQGTVQFGMASGDSVMLARAQGLPVKVVSTSSQRFPMVFFSKAEQNITKPEDLKGKSIGIPGRFGASYIGLLALLYASRIPESDLNIQEIGFTQVVALSEDKVQVVSGYGNNEPIQLEQKGTKVNVIKVADFYPLASDGIIASEQLISSDPALVRAFVRATLRGMQAVIDNPQEGFNTALQYIPEAQWGDVELQKKVLEATIPFWQSDATKQNGLGFTNSENWQATYTFLRDTNLLKSEIDINQAFTNDFIK